MGDMWTWPSVFKPSILFPKHSCNIAVVCTHQCTNTGKPASFYIPSLFYVMLLCWWNYLHEVPRNSYTPRPGPAKCSTKCRAMMSSEGRMLVEISLRVWEHIRMTKFGKACTVASLLRCHNSKRISHQSFSACYQIPALRLLKSEFSENSSWHRKAARK